MSRRRQLKAPSCCPTPSKVGFSDEGDATAALQAIWAKAIVGHPVPERAYLCTCERWHLTKMLTPHLTAESIVTA
jgi:hypothetical protein